MRPIDADALKQPIGSYNPIKYTYEYGDVITVADLDKAPTIEAVPIEDYKSMERTVNKLTQAIAESEPVKHGRWEWIGGYGYQYRCSECFLCAEHRTKYCPNCGAKMDTEEGEDHD